MASGRSSILRAAAILMSFVALCSCGIDEPCFVGTDIFTSSVIPEVHIEVPLGEWNALLKSFDKDYYTMDVIHCDVRYVDDAGETFVSNAGLRLHGNYSRVRPEGSTGTTHKRGATDTDWHHFHFILNFGAFADGSTNEVRGCDKLLFKWFHEDPTYVREIYSYDLFRRAGIWSAPDAAYSRIFIHVEGDSKEAYYGVYAMIEPIDKDFIKRRRQFFDDTDGFLWKCRLGASLNNFNSSTWGIDDDENRFLYTLKTNKDEFEAACTQMKNFCGRVADFKGERFNSWMETNCDMGLLMRTYAVNVVLGMWDDYWNNNNNYYLYFDSKDPENYKVYYIPYDYDNALGTCNMTGKAGDAGRADPFNWGLTSNKWISKALQNPQWREIYRQELLRLVAPENGLFDIDASQERIGRWHKAIMPYVKNDTHEDNQIADRPASWGQVGNYRLLGSDKNRNFFIVRTDTIHEYCD